MSGNGVADEAEAFVRTGRHGQGERSSVDAEVAQVAFAADVGDLDVVGGEEADDVLIAGVAAHGAVRVVWDEGCVAPLRSLRSSVPVEA